MLTGLNAAVSKFVTATATGRSPDDDLKLYKSILSGNDIIRGNRSGDQIEGFSGNDTLIGGGSSDILWGGKGAD
jgi:Ca2+-binding RTX toxin-like protein